MEEMCQSQQIQLINMFSREDFLKVVALGERENEFLEKMVESIMYSEKENKKELLEPLLEQIFG